MTKNLLLLSLLFLSLNSMGQESITFKIEVRPHKKYTVQLTTTSISEVDFIADQEIMDKIKENGMVLPIMTESKTELISVTTTESKNNIGEFPATIEYGKVMVTNTVNGNSTTEEKPFSGAKILGKYSASNQFLIDTIIGEKLTQQLRNILRNTLQSVQQQIKFPEKPMKVGETFKTETPLTIPMEGLNPIQVIVNMEYKLKKINGGKAFFDLKQIVSLNMAQEQVNVVANGEGFGTSEFDLKEAYITKYTSKLPMELTIKVNEKLTAKVVATTISEQNVIIE